ncbi:glutaminyl-peptide cyclotransferase [Dehalogenimonas sp. THU2]|uniref:glutaminyl-peptide cyclotransferase n=1 Tax=Dehalogenimonas sp. THU2 TaxID=3151121 RepID=UPI003218817E
MMWHRLGAGLLIAVMIAIGPVACGQGEPPPETTQAPQTTPPPEGDYSYRIVNTYPHDRTAFTQGLVYDGGFLYESTGLYGSSSVRKVDPATGQVLQSFSLSSQYFGEGLTLWQDSLIQLTWQSKVGFVYDKDTFDLRRDFAYTTEGWGLTHDGSRLIMSDGTATLYFLDPATFAVLGQVNVHDGGTPVVRLNELEYIEGRVFANIWQTNKIVIINPADGEVTGWIDLTGLLTPEQAGGVAVDVLNGIAWDAAGGRLLVTGKLWPLLFEIELVPVS